MQNKDTGIQYSSFWGNSVLCVDITVGAHNSHTTVYVAEDQYSDIRGMTLSQLRRARQARAVHRGMAFRDKNALSMLINRGYMTNMPIDPKLFHIANELFGPPHELIKAKTKRRKSPRLKIYGKLEEGELAMELDLVT